jgi:hypothetical protein
MTNDNNNNRPVGFYLAYLRMLHERRAAEGKPPAPDVFPAGYWTQRAEWHNEATKATENNMSELMSYRPQSTEVMRSRY